MNLRLHLLIPDTIPAVIITPSKVLQNALHANPVELSTAPTTIAILLPNVLTKIPANGAGTKIGYIKRWAQIVNCLVHIEVSAY